MQHYRKQFLALLAGFTIIFILAGCGGGGTTPPLDETTDQLVSVQVTDNPPTNVNQWGTWVIHCVEATAENPATATATPLRSGEVHVNVAEMLTPPSCTNCFGIEVSDVTGNDWTLDITLTNPSVLTGYDVMGVFVNTDGPAIQDAMSYTSLFDIDGDSDTLNPLILYDTGHADNEWKPLESHTQTFSFTKDTDDLWVDIIYVVAASYPDNQEEVVSLSNMNVSGPIYTDASEPVTITVDVLDWQDNVEYVLIDLSPVNGDAFTNLTYLEGNTWRLYSYAAYGLTPGTEELMIAAKSENSDHITYNYVTVDIEDPPIPPETFVIATEPTLLAGDGAPYGEMDLAVIGNSDETSKTFVFASATEIFYWDTQYSESNDYLTLFDTTGSDPDFPVSPVTRIAGTDPVLPGDMSTYSLLHLNTDTDPYDSTVNPPVLYENLVHILDMEELSVTNFRLTVNNTETPEMDAILTPADVSTGVGDDKYAYALWVPDGGQYPGYYPYVSLIRYEPPYKLGINEYSSLIGGVDEGFGEGLIDSDDVTGLAVWDGDGESDLLIAVAEGGLTGEVEIFTADYATNPAGELTYISTLDNIDGTPIDIAILPVGDSGDEDENWIAVLTDERTIEFYTASGEFVQTYDSQDAFTQDVYHMDIDVENLRVHVLMGGPRAVVLQYQSDGQ